MTEGAGAQFTAEQRDAVRINDKNLILVAGAGSGKTRVLVERYLQLLADNPDWSLKSLVAITFTRAAAFEMRHRLRLELEKRADASGDSLWLRRLSQMDSARIDTIHALCADILRANAEKAGIDPKFEVLDETEAAILFDSVVEDVLAALDPQWLALFANYDSFNILEAISQSNLISAELTDPPPQPQALLERWQREWADYVAEARDSLLADAAVIRLRDELRNLPNDKLGALYQQYGAALRSMEAESDGERLLQSMQDSYREGAVGNKGTASAWGGKAGKKAAAELLRQARQAIKLQLDRIGEPLGELDETSARMLPLWIGLLRALQSAWRQRKGDALLDFDDLERLASAVLEDESVRSRYRHGDVNHLLVDEFQDTNGAQWRIIQALADLNRGGTLFVVGDPKQSIYQFRGADISVFNRVRDAIARRDSGRALRLSTSFRSHRRLVAQFNALFSRLLARDPASPVADYEVEFEAPMRAFRDEAPDHAPVELLLLDQHEKDENGEYRRQAGSNRRIKIPAHELRLWEALEIGWHIQRLIASERPVYDREIGGFRPIAYRDIAILFQAMSNITLYEDRFKALGIPFQTIAGRGYFDRQEVWDMLDLLRCLHDPGDDLSLASALRSPMFGFSDDLLLALRLMAADDEDQRQPLPLWQALTSACDAAYPGIDASDISQLRFARQTLHELRAMSGRVTISALLDAALAKTGYLAILTSLPDGARRRGNIEKLLGLAHDSGVTALGKFSRYLGELSAREIREGEALIEAGNALRLMTVHASKGLEFPLVILADASWRLSGGTASTLMHDPRHGLSCKVFDEAAHKYASGFAQRRNRDLLKAREAAERKRLLYVAATRAQDYLLISGQCSYRKDQWSANGWLDQLLEAFDLLDIEAEPAQTIAFADDEIRVYMPPNPPSAEQLYGAIDEAMFTAEPAPSTPRDLPSPLPMLQPIAIQPDADLRHISATDLAARLNQDRGFDAPASAGMDQIDRDESRKLGTIMHALLQFDMLEAEDSMIASLAWQHGIRDAEQTRRIVDYAKSLRADYRVSAVYRWIAAANEERRPCHTEMRFIYRRVGCVMHGVIDLLMQREDGSWIIVDYKTSASQRDLSPHTPQLAIYAAAAQERLKLPRLPDAFLHFLLDNQTMPLKRQSLEAELRALDGLLKNLRNNHD